MVKKIQIGEIEHSGTASEAWREAIVSVCHCERSEAISWIM
jgi:hypothetical protein